MDQFDRFPRESQAASSAAFAGRPAGRLPHGGTAAEMLFVDPAVEWPSVLVEGRRQGIAVVPLAPGGRGLEQVAEHLAGRRGIGMLHLLCRGEPGALLLAGELIDLEALADRPAALSRLAGCFAAGAMIVLYGSSVAAGAAGLRFLERLETALGVAAAASAGPVGSAALGGRWIVRDRYGTPVEPAFRALARATYPALLGTGR